jgi:hypothetical protein
LRWTPESIARCVTRPRRLPVRAWATGNVCTEDLVHMFESMGCDTGVDPTSCSRSRATCRRMVHVPGQVMKAGPRPPVSLPASLLANTPGRGRVMNPLEVCNAFPRTTTRCTGCRPRADGSPHLHRVPRSAYATPCARAHNHGAAGSYGVKPGDRVAVVCQIIRPHVASIACFARRDHGVNRFRREGPVTS